METVVALSIAGVTGFGALFTRVNRRIDLMDRRIDGFELRVAEEYLTKSDFSAALDRVENHMIRIENKLDKLVT